ncbi:GLPGLI family protein [Pedobacter ginsengisoli]|uniref:GLPGLI family protein n=1 Tax=Pedobacter ginsengisoli TaxID=363852 RepID=UPI00254D1773|nr:GLPGLI family protein [Pedobacter ginsengisoli]
MKNFFFLFVILLLSGSHAASAQQTGLITSGTVEYTKTINMYALLKPGGDNVNELAFEQYKQQQPQFARLYSKLSFNNGETLFTPVSAGNLSAGFFSIPQIALQNSTVFVNHNNHTLASQKTVYDATYLLKDSVGKIRWRLTSELRDIAGYSCRRANGMTQDSLYVVAFYTDQIPVPGGPESFTGLPGMILQVALPHEHINWIASKVAVGPVAPAALRAPKKGRQIDRKGLKLRLRELSEQRKEPVTVNLKAFML